MYNNKNLQSLKVGDVVVFEEVTGYREHRGRSIAEGVVTYAQKVVLSPTGEKQWGQKYRAWPNGKPR